MGGGVVRSTLVVVDDDVYGLLVLVSVKDERLQWG